MRCAFIALACFIGVDGAPWRRTKDISDGKKAFATILLAHRPTLGSTRASHSPVMVADSKTPAARDQSISRRAAVLAPALSAPALLWPLTASALDFGGRYTDPTHPKCTRTLKVRGSDVTIVGFDEISGPKWTVKGKLENKKLVVDFTPKGGPSAVEAEWTGKGFKFPDGNVWTKLTGREVVASMPFTASYYADGLDGSEYKFKVSDGQVSLKASDGIGPELKWEAKGSVIGPQVFLDLSAKGEKEMVVGTLGEGGITFSNGMSWKPQAVR